MQTNTTPTLLQAIRQDPDTGLRWAMRDYAALVRGIARRILPGHDRDIEECTADVFVALWRNAARLEATGTPVQAWLIVTARNTAINRYRALQRHDTLPLTDELAATIADLPADPAGDAADELAVLVAALEPPDREIFLRKYYLMQSSREIAAALDGRWKLNFTASSGDTANRIGTVSEPEVNGYTLSSVIAAPGETRVTVQLSADAPEGATLQLFSADGQKLQCASSRPSADSSTVSYDFDAAPADAAGLTVKLVDKNTDPLVELARWDVSLPTE